MTTTTSQPATGGADRERPATGGDAIGGAAGPEPHVLLRFGRAVEEAFDRVADTAAWSMSPAEQRELLVVLDRLSARCAELQARVLAAADHNRVGADSGATSTAAWLAHATGQTTARCHAAVRLALALEEEFTGTAAALRAGRVNPDQARVVVEAVNRLTDEHDDLPADARVRAEAHLLDLAGRFDAAELRRLGKRLFEVVCPEAADAAEGEQLRKDEARARRLAQLSLRDNGDGTVEGRFRLPTLHGQLLKKSLQALTGPRRLGERGRDPVTGNRLETRALLGLGFMELLECHLDPARLPNVAGSPFTVLVTVGLDTLRSGIGAASLDTGGRISAGEARRLACTAGIIPMVLSGDDVPLNLGRKKRCHDSYQRIALTYRYKKCAAVNCDRPPAWLQIHHPHPWAAGGSTDLDNGLPLCPPHHYMADHPKSWNMHRLPDGGVRFSRRQ